MGVTTKVIRYGREEMVEHTAPASGKILAGDVIVENDADGKVTQATSTHDINSARLLVAIDDRNRGMEIGDSYSDGEEVHYVALSGGGVNVNLEDGQTLDPSSERRLVMSSTDGRVRPFSGDSDTDVLFRADTSNSISASGSEEPVPAMVVN